MAMSGASHSILQKTIRQTYPSIFWVFIFSLAINILFLTSSLYMMQVFDRVMSSRSYDTLFYLTVIALLALAVLSGIEMVRSHVMVRVSSWVDAKLSTAAFDRVIGAALDNKGYSTQAMRDLSSLRGAVSGSGLFPLFDMPWAPIYLAVLYGLHPMLGHLSLAGCVVLFLFAIVNEVATRGPLARSGAAGFGAMALTECTTRNAQSIDAMGMGSALRRKWYTQTVASRAEQCDASDRAGLILAGSKFFRQSLQIAVFALGAALALQQEISAGAMIAASMLMGRALAPVEQAITTWKQVITTRQAYARLKIFFNARPRRDDSMRLPAPAGHIQVEDVSFAMGEPPRPILKRNNLEVLPGEVLALIGHSAAGKSTLAKLMAGIYKPSAGAVRLDGADIFLWSRDDVGKHLGYLPQEVELFTGTVAENVARMEEPDPEAVADAAKMAGAHEMILKLADGYDTFVGENGAALSGGQRQRIGLARALYRKPCMVILDEPNSNLDGEGEAALRHAVEEMKGYGAAVVIISHRPSVLSLVDKIAFMRGGVIEIYGPPDEVLARLRGQAPAEAKGALPKQDAQAPKAIANDSAAAAKPKAIASNDPAQGQTQDQAKSQTNEDAKEQTPDDVRQIPPPSDAVVARRKARAAAVLGAVSNRNSPGGKAAAMQADRQSRAAS